MTEILYSKKGEEKYLDIRWVFKVDLNPATKAHLAQVLESYLKPKGVPMEDDSHRIEIL